MLFICAGSVDLTKALFNMLLDHPVAGRGGERAWIPKGGVIGDRRQRQDMVGRARRSRSKFRKRPVAEIDLGLDAHGGSFAQPPGNGCVGVSRKLLDSFDDPVPPWGGRVVLVRLLRREA